MVSYCSQCKSYRDACEVKGCPLASHRGEVTHSPIPRIGQVASLTPPGIFIGSYGYPKVYVGPLAVSDMSKGYPTGKEYGLAIDEILALNRNIYRASRKIGVSTLEERYTRSIQEASMSSSHLDLELRVSRRIRGDIDRDMAYTSPLATMVEISSMEFSSNPKVPRKVDYYHGDNDFKADEAVWGLYRSGFGIPYLEGVFSSGSLGLKDRRRLVPTRWSITAVDDIIYRRLKEEILRLDTISEISVFKNSYVGNAFTIILLPYTLQYEMMESWDTVPPQSNPKVSIDFEFVEDRKTYASNVGGAYYAARMAVFEHLLQIRRQAAVIVIRTIGKEYYSPLGVWVVRETVRDAFNKDKSIYQSLEELVRDVRTGISSWQALSNVLRRVRVQKSIMDYI